MNPEPLKGKVKYYNYPKFGGNPESCFLFKELSPILECLEKCSKLRVINGIARGLYTNNECYCVFYTEAFRVKWNESLANSLIEIEGDNITLR